MVESGGPDVQRRDDANERPSRGLLLERFQPLELRLDTSKGRGVFTTTVIPANTLIDISPVLILDAAENKAHIEKTELYHYTYNWPHPTQPGSTTQAVVFGLGSMFNHSTRAQNVGWTRDLEKKVIVYRTLRRVEAGEELCISYGGPLSFVDVDEESARWEEVEAGEEVLARIGL